KIINQTKKVEYIGELDEFRTNRLFSDASDQIEFRFIDSENGENGTMFISLSDPDDELFSCLNEMGTEDDIDENNGVE
ncbi:hypothetical protein U2E78_05740, partial [Acinetobacter baumannii]